MTTIKKQIVITDETILSFYRENPNIDFITMNHIFIDILKKLSTNLTETLSNAVNSKILKTLSEINGSVSSIKQDVNKLNSELVNSITVKIQDSKKEYMDSINILFTNQTLSNSEKFGSMLEKHTDALITKTAMLVNEIIPKTHETYHTKIESSIQGLSRALSEGNSRLSDTISKNTPEQSIKEYIANVETQFNKMMLNIQQPIFSFIQSSEERTTNNIQTIREKITNQQSIQEALSIELNGFLHKYKYNSSMKGNVSETELYSVLQLVFPSDEILDCRGETATCDYRVNRLHKNKPTILFENKDYSRSATTEEILKFERDIALQKCHGVFLSQHSNITYKENFQIDMIDGFIHVYIPNAQYSPEKIQIAVDIIDNLAQKLQYISHASQNTLGFHIQQEDMDDLLEEYIEFNRKKTQLIETIRNSNKHVIEKLEEIQFISVKRVLIKNGALQTEEEFKCKYCNSFIGKGKASLGAHMRSCKSNPTRNTIVESNNSRVL